MKTKLKYQKKRLRPHLIVGGILSVLGVFFYLTNAEVVFFEPIVWVAFGLLNFVIYGYMRFFQYATIKDGTIVRHTLFNKSIDLKNLEKVDRKHGDLIIFSENKKLTLNLDFLEIESLNFLNEILFEAGCKTVQQ